MARRFVRVDLSDRARDFRPIAVEPGVPWLDRPNANSKILFKWLGGLVAEPEWEGESVSFFVRDDYGGRLEDVVCQPASQEDLAGPLRQDVETLSDRIAKARPEDTSQRAVHNILQQTFQGLTEAEDRADHDSYFFKYRDVLGRWRLVWCWGYQRADLEPAPAVICTDPDCNLLFVRRPGQSPKCPSCEAALAAAGRKRKSPRRAVIAGLLLFLLGCLATYWLLSRNRLIAEPETWTGRAGSRVEFQVRKWGLLGGTDVSQEAVAVVEDPRIVRMDAFGTDAVARSPGKTVVRFYLGNNSTTATLTVTAAENPTRIRIEPELVELGVGTTAHLKVFGEYADGSSADLTRAAEWEPDNDGVVFAHGGFVEGLAEGTSTIHVRYRASPEDEHLRASVNVSVTDVSFKSLEMAVRPDPVPVGRAGKLQIDAVTEGGERYSVLESSLLEVDVEPAYVAGLHGTYVVGSHPGRGTMTAAFNGQLSGRLEFDVVQGAGIESLVVAPERLQMAVGEIADLSIASPSREPIRLASSDPKVVEVTRQKRLIGRSEGNARVEVRQGAAARTVDVVVTKADVESIAVEPPRVVVPVDHSTPVRVMGQIEKDRIIELAPGVIACEKRPSPRYAEFDGDSMEVRGVRPTEQSSPQSLAFRSGKLVAEAPVVVMIAPLRLELTPSGNVDVPLGQQVPIDAWATYRGGYRVQVAADRVSWQSDPPSGQTPGLELRGNKVAALKAGVGPLAVWGTYLGRHSDHATFNSVEAAAVRLKLEADRTIRLAGEPGRVILTGTGPQGDVDLVPELAAFESSDPNVLKIEAASGAFRAEQPGGAVVTARHVASSEPAGLELSVVDAANARLIFDPRSIQVVVDEVGRLDLFLEAKVGDEIRRAPMVGPGVGYAIEQPEAIRWHPPRLVGLAPAAPFEMAASYLPYLLRPATAKVEVVAADQPEQIRIVPADDVLAPGQILPLGVEERLPGSDQWKEVRPDVVAWDVPPEVLWTPATEGLRPAVTAVPGAAGRAGLTATYRGRQASCELTIRQPELSPASPNVRLVLEREPPGRYLPVGQEQRCSIWLEMGGQRELAASVQWLEDFENEYVRWRAPILTAKRAGYEQWLRAKVGERWVRWYTHTIDPFAPGSLPPRREDQPEEVVILSDQGPAVQFPVGARFDDFRIEARYADGFVRLVTKKATMSTAGSFTETPVSFSGGSMIGVRPGQTVVHAEFDGVPTKQGLDVAVTQDVDLDEIRLKPTPVAILPGETITLDAEGFRGGRSVGVITGLGRLNWTSGQEEVVAVNGPSVTGLKLGRGRVMARLGPVTSDPAEVSVVDSIADRLVVDQDVIQMRVGESRRVGSDLAVFRGNTDWSLQCEVTPALPNVVRYVPDTHSLVGVSPGVSAVTFARGDQLAAVTVQVLPAGGLQGEVLVEPATAILSPGQAIDLRVFLVTEDGLRIDRTDSAVLGSSLPGGVTIRGTRACAVAPGSSEITAQLPEARSPGKAYLTVNGEPITDLVVEPSQLAMSVGQTARLRILGSSSSGTYDLFPQPDLKVAAGGAVPQAIRIVGSEHVDAVTAGEAEVAVDWQGRLSRQVPVAVTDSPLADLAIEPGRATIHPGQGLVYRVSGLVGGRRRVLGPEDGVQLFTGDASVAESVGGMVVVGTQPGRTHVIAQLGSSRAEAALDVTPGTAPPSGDVVTGGAPGYGYIGPDYLVDGVRRHIIRHGPGYVVTGPAARHVINGGTTYVEEHAAPAAGVAALRFIPDVVRMAADSPGARVRVFEVLADGTLGRDVTGDPNLEFNTPGNVATVERTDEGPVVRPVAAGHTRIAAKIGMELFAEPELLVQVGDVPSGLARLEVAPDPLVLWPGEGRWLDRVAVTPGPGQSPIDVGYSITVPADQDVVTVEPDGRLRGLSGGAARVVVTAVEPGTRFDGLTTTATVHVTSPDRLWIEPPGVSVRVGETTPRMTLMAEGGDRRPHQVPAVLESMDEGILRPDGRVPGCFVAASLGGTQVRAVYRDREVLAMVTVTGERFLDVKTELSEGQEDFFVTIEVLAAGSEGPLEYRVEVVGEARPEVWVPAEQSGQYRRAVLRSPRIKYGPRTARYSLMLEARSSEDGSVQRYPFTFRLAPSIERMDIPE